MLVVNIQNGLDLIGSISRWAGLDWVNKNGPMSNSVQPFLDCVYPIITLLAPTCEDC